MDLTQGSVNQLAEYVGKDHRTIKRRLAGISRGPDPPVKGFS